MADFAEGELTESATCKAYLQVRQEGARQVERNLRRNMPLAPVGYAQAATEMRAIRGMGDSKK